MLLSGKKILKNYFNIEINNEIVLESNDVLKLDNLYKYDFNTYIKPLIKKTEHKLLFESNSIKYNEVVDYLTKKQDYIINNLPIIYAIPKDTTLNLNVNLDKDVFTFNCIGMQGVAKSLNEKYLFSKSGILMGFNKDILLKPILFVINEFCTENQNFFVDDILDNIIIKHTIHTTLTDKIIMITDKTVDELILDNIILKENQKNLFALFSHKIEKLFADFNVDKSMDYIALDNEIDQYNYVKIIVNTIDNKYELYISMQNFDEFEKSYENLDDLLSKLNQFKLDFDNYINTINILNNHLK